MLYNRFEQVTKISFRELVDSGYGDFVLQRFEWPDVKDKTGFLLTPYDDKETADQHAHQLRAKEGRALQMPLFLPEDLERQWIEDIQEDDMPPIFLFEIPNEKLKHYPVYRADYEKVVVTNTITFPI